MIRKGAFKLADQIFFCQRLSILLESGISLVEALVIMSDIDVSKHRKKIYGIVIKDLEKGISLAKSIRNTGVKFNHLLITLIQNGEVTGGLGVALAQAHSYMEKKNEMKKKIISSLIYPAFIVFTTIAMTFFLILFIFPKIIPLLKSLNIELPLITRIVQAFYYFSISYGIWVIIGMLILITISYFLNMKIFSFKYKIHLFLIHMPFFSKYIQIYIMASICSMAETLLNSGRSLPDTLAFSRESVRNVVYKRVFSLIHDESVRGVSLADSLRKYSHIFPSILINMCDLGERTGHLAHMLGHSAKIFEQDIDNAQKRLSSLIEPMLMVLMGLIVGSIALSIILPVYEITNHLTK
ncbi:MAG TPA: type II secretion system F family protein [Candidatus Paceibacterota bacterium]